MISAALQEAGADLRAFWEQLPRAVLAEEAGVQLMKLQGGTSFLGVPDLGDTLVLRECYRGLQAKIQQLFEGGARAVAVIGNPGEERVSCAHLNDTFLTSVHAAAVAAFMLVCEATQPSLQA